MKSCEIKITVNGAVHTLDVSADTLLVSVLRDQLNLIGTKHACGDGECGACTVILNGKSVLSCLTLACECNNAQIMTIEGLAKNEKELHPIQQAFVDKGAVQCGFCTPGMILSSKYLLDTNPDPSDEEIEEGLAGNICRCTGYVKIVDAVKDAADKLKDKNGGI
jgi:carbon-monoxide dehydrogenase small subunit